MTDLENNITSHITTRITTRISALQLRIDHARSNSSINNSVKLLAVSKTQKINSIKMAYDCGLRLFGENYVQEAADKIPFLPADIEWHFIGPIQSNKTRFIAENFSWVQTIDRLKIAERLSEQRPAHLPPLQCLLQINISNEPQKAGISANELLSLAEKILSLKHLTLRGLMAIPNPDQSQTDLENDFANMALLLRQLHNLTEHADTLSMGMSADLETAIAHGSTMVRVGTDLFGSREYQ
jgi:pyridoxal phosphate enzyme (YggS family)